MEDAGAARTENAAPLVVMPSDGDLVVRSLSAQKERLATPASASGTMSNMEDDLIACLRIPKTTSVYSDSSKMAKFKRHNSLSLRRAITALPVEFCDAKTGNQLRFEGLCGAAGGIHYSVNGEPRPTVYHMKYYERSSVLKFPELERGVNIPRVSPFNQRNQKILSCLQVLCKEAGVRNDLPTPDEMWLMAPLIQNPNSTLSEFNSVYIYICNGGGHKKLNLTVGHFDDTPVIDNGVLDTARTAGEQPASPPAAIDPAAQSGAIAASAAGGGGGGGAAGGGTLPPVRAASACFLITCVEYNAHEKILLFRDDDPASAVRGKPVCRGYESAGCSAERLKLLCAAAKVPFVYTAGGTPACEPRYLKLAGNVTAVLTPVGVRHPPSAAAAAGGAPLSCTSSEAACDALDGPSPVAPGTSPASPNLPATPRRSADTATPKANNLLSPKAKLQNKLTGFLKRGKNGVDRDLSALPPALPRASSGAVGLPAAAAAHHANGSAANAHQQGTQAASWEEGFFFPKTQPYTAAVAPSREARPQLVLSLIYPNGDLLAVREKLAAAAAPKHPTPLRDAAEAASNASNASRPKSGDTSLEVATAKTGVRLTIDVGDDTPAAAAADAGPDLTHKERLVEQVLKLVDADAVMATPLPMKDGGGLLSSTISSLKDLKESISSARRSGGVANGSSHSAPLEATAPLPELLRTVREAIEPTVSMHEGVVSVLVKGVELERPRGLLRLRTTAWGHEEPAAAANAASSSAAAAAARAAATAAAESGSNNDAGSLNGSQRSARCPVGNPSSPVAGMSCGSSTACSLSTSPPGSPSVSSKRKRVSGMSGIAHSMSNSTSNGLAAKTTSTATSGSSLHYLSAEAQTAGLSSPPEGSAHTGNPSLTASMLPPPLAASAAGAAAGGAGLKGAAAPVGFLLALPTSDPRRCTDVDATTYKEEPAQRRHSKAKVGGNMDEEDDDSSDDELEHVPSSPRLLEGSEAGASTLAATQPQAITLLKKASSLAEVEQPPYPVIMRHHELKALYSVCAAGGVDPRRLLTNLSPLQHVLRLMMLKKGLKETLVQEIAAWCVEQSKEVSVLAVLWGYGDDAMCPESRHVHLKESWARTSPSDVHNALAGDANWLESRGWDGPGFFKDHAVYYRAATSSDAFHPVALNPGEALVSQGFRPGTGEALHVIATSATEALKYFRGTERSGRKGAGGERKGRKTSLRLFGSSDPAEDMSKKKDCAVM